MVRLLGPDDFPSVANLVSAQTAERCRNFLQGHYFKLFGLYDDALTAFVCVHFNDDINAWSPFIIHADAYKDRAMLLDYSASYAEKRGFFQWFTVNPETAVPQRYLVSADEKVPAHERPMTNVYWDWLFYNVTRPEETVVVHHWLPRNMRPL